jgi:hypothetical protein
MLKMLKIVGVIIWALSSSLIAVDIGQFIPLVRSSEYGSYSGAPDADPITFWRYAHDAAPWLALWLLTWVAGIILWVVLSSVWRRLRVPARKAGRNS